MRIFSVINYHRPLLFLHTEIAMANQITRDLLAFVPHSNLRAVNQLFN